MLMWTDDNDIKITFLELKNTIVKKKYKKQSEIVRANVRKSYETEARRFVPNEWKGKHCNIQH